jgi:hypothetical protein
MGHCQRYFIVWPVMKVAEDKTGGRGRRDRMVVGFITTYHH